tara:strand:+ start:2196 stop:3437 length:1242 start_codon:yes stop_codon:yes gene_type:complete
MGIKSGPSIVSDGVVFCIDAASNRSIGKAGCMGFNSAPQLIKNLANTGQSISSTSTLKLGNLTYYTIYGLTYSEASQTPANRDGITPGFNDTSSSKLLDFSRDLNYAVWDNATNSWVADSYFNGERLAGHCYDTYDTAGNAATEHVQFQNDHAAIKSAYPDATHIVVGSHAAENNDSDSNTLAILKDLGGASSWPTDRAEYVLIGKPGLGPDNAYVWQYQNNSANVAHANVGLPIVGGKGAGGNYLDFNGSDEYISLPDDIGYTDAVSVFAWFKRDTNTGILGGYHIICGTHYLELSVNDGGDYLRNGIVVNGTRYVSNDGSAIGTGTWHYVGFTWSTSDYYKRSYVDGVNVGTQSTGSTGTSDYSFSGRSLGMWNGSSYALNGKIAAYQVYNRALTQAEVIQNYNATKTRFL